MEKVCVKLEEGDIGSEYIIKKIETDKKIKIKLYSLGIHEGSKVKVEYIDDVIIISIENSLVALDKNISKKIEVEKIEI